MKSCMRKSGPRPSISIVLLIVALGAGMTSARAADGQAAGGGFWDKALETLNLKTKPTPMPDFVETSRPDPSAMKYIPTGETHPKHGIPVKTPAEIEAAKQSLDAARQAQLGLKPTPAKPPAAKLVAPKPKIAPNRPTAAN